MKKVELLVKNAVIVTMDSGRRILQHAALAVDQGSIIALGDSLELEKKYAGTHTVDAKNKIIFPGLINTHDHLFQMLLKGLAKDIPLVEWLDASVRPAIAHIGPEEIYLAAKVGLMEQLASGTTTCVDYQYAHGKLGLDEAVLQAMDDIGIRGVLAKGYANTANFPATCSCEFNETEDNFFASARELHERYKDHPRLAIAMAPGIIYDFSKDAFIKMRELADETGMRITMHTVETKDDNIYALEKYGMREFPFFESIGVLGGDFLAVHCVDVDEEDLRLFAKYDIQVSYNPLSNMIMGYDVTPIVEMRKKGINVSLALDGAASNDNQNMLEVLKATALLQKCHHRNPAVMTAAEVLEMATLGGARAIGLADEIGSLEVGKKADFFLFNPIHLNSVPIADPISALIYTGCEHNIEMTVVEGKVVYEQGECPGIVKEEILYALQKAGSSIRAKAGLGNEQWGQWLSLGEFEN
ncbi:MAG: amidohydrolase [Clostridia bacterium]